MFPHTWKLSREVSCVVSSMGVFGAATQRLGQALCHLRASLLSFERYLEFAGSFKLRSKELHVTTSVIRESHILESAADALQSVQGLVAILETDKRKAAG